MLEPLSVGLWAVTRGGVHMGDVVLIMGAGPIGAWRTAETCGAMDLWVDSFFRSFSPLIGLLTLVSALAAGASVIVSGIIYHYRSIVIPFNLF